MLLIILTNGYTIPHAFCRLLPVAAGSYYYWIEKREEFIKKKREERRKRMRKMIKGREEI